MRDSLFDKHQISCCVKEEENPGEKVEEVKVKSGISGRYNYIFIFILKFSILDVCRSPGLTHYFEGVLINRSSRPEVFCKKGVLKNFTKFTGKHLCQSLFFNKVAGLNKVQYNFLSINTSATKFCSKTGDNINLIRLTILLALAPSM